MGEILEDVNHLIKDSTYVYKYLSSNDSLGPGRGNREAEVIISHLAF